VSDIIRSRPLMSGAVALILFFLLIAAFPIISETKQAVVVQFGKPSRILGSTRAGINFRVPLFEQLVWIDKRVQSVDMDRQQVLSTDQRRLEVDAAVRVPLARLLEHPTPAALSRFLEGGAIGDLDGVRTRVEARVERRQIGRR